MAVHEKDVSDPIHRISVIVPNNPFLKAPVNPNSHCLCALDVVKLMEWWPGLPHSPHRDASKVKAIQRSLDWKRVAHIASYLLQEEIFDAPSKINKYFGSIYEPKKNEPGREWPPRVTKIVSFQRSEFPTFSNVLIHVNGAKIEKQPARKKPQSSDEGPNKAEEEMAARLVFDETDKKLNFSVIDGQHRINGAYLAIKILQETRTLEKWEIPAEIFLDLDPLNEPPMRQAQIFIDVNFNQRRVDRSLVADLFPTARANRESLDHMERAQDIGRKLMLEIGPLVGMIQIPGIKFGVKDVITLSTLNGAVEDIIDVAERQGIIGLEMQTELLAQCLTAWFEASGRFENKNKKKIEKLSPLNVAYQGRILVSIIALVPGMIWELKRKKIKIVSENALLHLSAWLKEIAIKGNLLENGVFIDKKRFKKLGYVGGGGIGRFRDLLWAGMTAKEKLDNNNYELINELANKNREIVARTYSQAPNA